MKTGWIKLHRKALEHGVFSDKSAWRIFTWLLLSVDRDTGTITVGRYQLAGAVGLKPPTVQKALLRLSKSISVISLKVSPAYTMISVKNWDKYQDKKEEVSGQVSEMYQQSITKQEDKNKNINIYTQIGYLKNVPPEDVDEFTTALMCSPSQVRSKAQDVIDYCERKGVKYKNYKATLRTWLRKDYLVRKALGPIVTTNLPELSMERRMANIKKIEDMKKLHGLN